MLRQFLYNLRYLSTASDTRSKKKIRTRVQMYDIKLNFFKNLRYNSKYLCWSVQNKIIKNPDSRMAKFHVFEQGCIQSEFHSS